MCTLSWKYIVARICCKDHCEYLILQSFTTLWMYFSCITTSFSFCDIAMKGLWKPNFPMFCYYWQPSPCSLASSLLMQHENMFKHDQFYIWGIMISFSFCDFDLILEDGIMSNHDQFYLWCVAFSFSFCNLDMRGPFTPNFHAKRMPISCPKKNILPLQVLYGACFAANDSLLFMLINEKWIMETCSILIRMSANCKYGFK